MAQTKQADATGKPPFVLKHRIAGAAFLIFFGALVLPWLLGPPSEANRVESSSSSGLDDHTISSEQIEDELLAGLEQEPPIEEEVYISKITPLDSQNHTQLEGGSEGTNSPTSSSNSSNSSSDAAKAAAEKQKADDLAAQRAAAAKAEKDRLAKAAAEKEEQEKRRKAEALAKRQADIESDLAEALEAEAADVEAAAAQSGPVAADNQSSATPRIEIGWAVQVGLFENKTGANRVVEDLKSKGFKPSVTIVDTNRGKATGTRVWLGPFAQRVDAAKEMSRLADRTGQAGFIRAYP